MQIMKNDQMLLMCYKKCCSYVANIIWCLVYAIEKRVWFIRAAYVKIVFGKTEMQDYSLNVLHYRNRVYQNDFATLQKHVS